MAKSRLSALAELKVPHAESSSAKVERMREEAVHQIGVPGYIHLTAQCSFWMQ